MFHISVPHFSNTSKPSPERQSRHLVYTGQYSNGKIGLIIHEEGTQTALHLCYSVFLEANGGTRVEVKVHKAAQSPSVILTEHGWFQDPALFTNICVNQAAPNQLTPESFASWRTEVLTTLETNHGALWVPLVDAT